MDLSVGNPPLSNAAQFSQVQDAFARRLAEQDQKINEYLRAHNPVRAANAANDEGKYDDGKEEAVYVPGQMHVVLASDEVRDVLEDLGRNVAASAASSSSSSQQVSDEEIERAVNPFVEDRRPRAGEQRVGLDIFFPAQPMNVEQQPRLNEPPDNRLDRIQRRRQEVDEEREDDDVYPRPNWD